MTDVVPTGSKSKKLPENMDEEVREDLMKSKLNLSIDNVQMDREGVISCRIRYEKEGDYRTKEKFFDNWKKFSAYADKFFAIDREKDQDNA